ncbi:iron chelate uptake ABC transporter family permease subunit [Hoyosella rhizosphaerae]|nr:iron chelate uptake ABC transporter family permease subunit [Hoyosella rhizosphaerae]
MRIGVLTVVALLVVGLYLFSHLPRAWELVLPMRLTTVGALIVVAYAIGISTVMFQTVTANRILTPALMGFDSLYILIQTVLVFVFGAAAMVSYSVVIKYLSETIILVGFTLVLYWLVFRKGRSSIHILLLVGIVFGVFFRSVSNLVQRLIEPAEFAVLQDMFFASFTRIDPVLLAATAAMCVLVTAVGAKYWHTFDVLLLGRDTAVSLGVNYQRMVIGIFIATSVLVAASTALVGPITFFGLLVANLAYLIAGNHLHRNTLPIAVLLGVITLVGGQWLLARVFSQGTTLSIIIEFAGGIVLIYLLLRGRAVR